ncbi:MAG: 50S ribosomal protein L24 [Candidatus Spechtbacterales bacterium]|nr:50S ribosomal protein L24 [Candidatus Spechtbacterales bacterium]
MKVKKGDKVLIIHGKNRGKTGKVISTLPRRSRVVVEGVNMQKKHVRPRRQGEQGEIVELPGPIDISNVKVVCPRCGKAARMGHKKEGEAKVRLCKKCGKSIK